ncbi:MAG: acyltransferase family protein [Acidobacteria bacterium]|nr:acyltransferase family protein [Acidobacteriota bacterium]
MPDATNPADFRLAYRPEIDGLRAVAVLLVVLFHAGLGFPGGYVGVDVFFVISGFLITSLVLKEIELGRFSMLRFWERRVRRLAPAMLAMIFGVLVVGWFLLLAQDYAELASSVLWQIACVANVFFWRNTGYFAGGADEKPLLHTWSLAVEEQFYLALPLLLVLVWRSAPGNPVARCRAFFALIIVGSLALSAYATSAHAAAAFYLLPSRAWELAFGGLLATLPKRWFPVKAAAAEVGALLGLALICGAAVLFNEDTPFPGTAALAPCLGAAAFIWASSSRSTASSRILSTRPAVAVGLLSYSLYLWHWPVLAFMNYWALSRAQTASRLLAVGLALALAGLSYALIEQPFRRKRVLADRRSSVLAFAGSVSFALVAAALITQMQGLPSRHSPRAEQFAADAREPHFSASVKPQDLERGRLNRFGASGGDADLLLWGDSHAMAVAPALDRFLAEKGRSGLAVTHPATAPILDFVRNAKFGLGADAIPQGRAVLELLERSQVKDVFLVARWSNYQGEPLPGERGDFEAGLLRTVEGIRSEGARPWIVREVPAHFADVPKALAFAAITGSNPLEFASRPTHQPHEGWSEGFVAQLEERGAVVLDPRPAFYDARTQTYLMQYDDHALYRDSHHLTPYGAEQMILPLLRAAAPETSKQVTP